jgi:hypothetical protein
MELEGRLIAYNWKAPIDGVPLARISVNLVIEFGEHVWPPAGLTEGEAKQYIGRITMGSGRLTEEPPSLFVYSEIWLPQSVFSELACMKDSEIVFQTVHDLQENPGNEANAALVKRVEFEELIREKKAA